jgi:hypothetical protein
LPVEVFGSGRGVRAVLERDERLGALAPALVGYRDNRALEHGGMAADDLLDLDRRDVLAAGDDDALAAVAQFDRVIRVPDGEIAGVEPAAAKRLRGRLGRGVVAGNHVVAAHHHLAHHGAVARHVAHVLVEHADEVGGRIPLALAGEQPSALVRWELVPLVARRADGVRPVRLGQPVDVHAGPTAMGEPRPTPRRHRPSGRAAAA